MTRTVYNLPNHAHFLTFSCDRRRRLLTDELLRGQLVRTWDSARRDGKFAIWSYVIMPEHIHLLVYPEDEHYEMSSILRLLKERFARWVVARWQEHDSYMLERIKIQRGNRIVHRFWQEGGDYDRNLCDWDKIRRAVDYIEWNPVRRGLVTDPLDWKWSSAQARVGYADVPLRVDEIDMDRVEKV